LIPVGGPGNDTLSGSPFMEPMFGGAGDDIMYAQDGPADTGDDVNCGAGYDIAYVDVAGEIENAIGVCEVVILP
jgi:hypothetical protein